MRVSPSECTEQLNKGEQRVREELEKAFPKSSYIALPYRPSKAKKPMVRQIS